MAFKNKLFVIGDYQPTGITEPFINPTIVDGVVKGENSGYIISAADFNTYFRSVSLFTYSIADIIGEDSGNELSFSTSKDEAKKWIEDALQKYIKKIKVNQSTNLVPEGSENNCLYYINGETTYCITQVDDKIGNKTIIGYNKTGVPSKIDSSKIDTHSALYIKGSDGKYYQLSFSLDNTNKVLTINWANK